MNPFVFLLGWLVKAVHLKPHQLKGAPGVKTDKEAAELADHINQILPGVVLGAAAAHGVVVNPEQLLTPVGAHPVVESPPPEEPVKS